MIYNEVIKDLFSVDDNYYLAHCISVDFGMGKGIVLEFNKRFDMKRKLQYKYPNYINEWCQRQWTFNCILEDRVFNLITKERYFHKPTYDSLYGALNLMKLICIQKSITQIAMPMIGSGLDRLDFNRVREQIKEIFKETNIEILVCKKEV